MKSLDSSIRNVFRGRSRRNPHRPGSRIRRSRFHPTAALLPFASRFTGDRSREWRHVLVLAGSPTCHRMHVHFVGRVGRALPGFFPEKVNKPSLSKVRALPQRHYEFIFTRPLSRVKRTWSVITLIKVGNHYGKFRNGGTAKLASAGSIVFVWRAIVNKS